MAAEAEVDLAEVDRIVAEEFDSDKGNLIMILQALQDRFNYLPAEALVRLAAKLEMPLATVYTVTTFYASFSLAPRGRHIISVCTGTACHLKGSALIAEDVAQNLGIEPGGTTPDLAFSLETVNCLGACALAPVAVVDKKYYPQTDLSEMQKLVEKLKAE
ncbi:MAG: NAD(P)H-dependent oxidoreductase subunit E [Deltaproteobacteria bacterium]|nr:NAD(P)H-dependent oxidoreductase subunit E [Deltaproteobacteria bacterium]